LVVVLSFLVIAPDGSQNVGDMDDGMREARSRVRRKSFMIFTGPRESEGNDPKARTFFLNYLERFNSGKRITGL